jgi:hypothetical protein
VLRRVANNRAYYTLDCLHSIGPFLRTPPRTYLVYRELADRARHLLHLISPHLVGPSAPQHFLADIMGVGAFIEPLVIVSLLFGGTWVNRNTRYRIFDRRSSHGPHSRSSSPSSTESGHSSPRSSSSLLDHHRGLSPSLLVPQEPHWRKREVRLFGWRRKVVSPNTRRFEGYFLSRLLRKFPFLVEAWYWALIYWVGQTCVLSS